ncbi:GEVED domain-containing protein [uncultured Lacinutrix sp.]|uniref:GEVED domain-containing protein n=1 Tax=uncultured Lacinutrix sp. TaxID=574032 RepID=UPI00261E89A5|nr:GEVED domain-containing protein [uncultured Lacinutrix sp.]
MNHFYQVKFILTLLTYVFFTTFSNAYSLIDKGLPPSNDTPCTAIPLSQNSTCVFSTYTNATATDSGIANPGCANYQGGDVWFSVVVPANGEITLDTNTGVVINGGMALYSGTCSSLTFLECNNNSSANGNMPYIYRTGLTPGDTLYVRFWEAGNNNNGTFDICAVGLVCLAPTVDAATNITLTSATINWTAPSIAPSNGYQYVLSTVSTPPTGAGTPTTNTSQNITGLTADTIYYLYVRSDCDTNGFSSWTSVYSFSTGYCLSTSSNSTNYIDNFSTSGGIANITNNGSGYSTSGYGNFTAASVSQVNDGSISFSSDFVGGTHGFNIWVDWNDDFTFNNTDEKVFASGGYNASNTGTFTVPSSASIGDHRMRIRIDYFDSDPVACGVITYSETEDYTFNVASALPCSGNPTSITAVPTSQTTATISWTEGTPVPSNGYDYYVTTSTLAPNPTDTPTGSTAAGITTANLTGLVTGDYYVWVRANCGGTGDGVWVGPTYLYVPNCAIGPGTGTTTLGCPSVVSGGLGLNGVDPASIACSAASSNIDLEATFLDLGDTSTYNVESIAYAPPYQYECLINPVSVNSDDVWSPVVNLPFDFCFYGNTYNEVLIGSNGIITFDISTPGSGTGYQFSNDLPSTANALFANTIYGVYHDIDPSVGGEVGWELITLNTGCRALVASWHDVPMYSDNSILYTGMIVLYENTNVIEVYIEEKNIDGTWNDGNAIVGIQNDDATQAVVAPGRNGLDADWTVTNEAWRFVPAGTSITQLTWYEGSGTSGASLGNTNTISVNPTSTTTYTAEVVYTLCDGSTLIETDETTVTILPSKIWNGSTSSNWAVAANWTPSGVPINTDCVQIPVTANDPIISSLFDGDALSVLIEDDANLTIESDCTLSVVDAISIANNGDLFVEDDGSIIQVNDVNNVGNITMDRVTNINKLDYVYWSSPVNAFPILSVSPNTPASLIWEWTPTIANNFGNWASASGNMSAGKGYAVRGPSTYTSTPQDYTATFIGIANNGEILMPISRGTYTGADYMGPSSTLVTNQDDNWNLIGNPYPSAIDADDFMTLNTNIDGAVYLWAHLIDPSAANPDPFYSDYVYNYSSLDYITYNSTGSTPPGFNGEIAAGQGFFVFMNESTASTNETVTFNNSLRDRTYNNNQFYRANNTNQNDTEKHRIWLDLVAPSGLLNRVLIGYVENATNEKDRLYDAYTNKSINSQSFYSLIEEEKMVIQGKKLPFNDDDTVALGLSIYEEGAHTISINKLDGLFENRTQNIFIEDLETGTLHNLLNSPYIFTANSNIINNRFVLRYKDPSVIIEDVIENSEIIIELENNVINVTAGSTIKDIVVYDVIGRTLFSFNNINLSTISLDNINKTNNVLLIKATLNNGKEKVKKVVH